MKMHILIAGAAGSLALVACGTDTSEDASAANELAAEETNVAMNDAAEPALAAQEFVTAIAGSDMYEIESGKLAQEKATAADLKSFGEMLVTDHTKSTTQLKAAAAEASPPLTVPATMPPDLQAKIDALRAASGAEFDRLFVEQQIEGHRKALDMLRAYASSGDQQPLRDFASTAQGVVEGHLNQISSRQ